MSHRTTIIVAHRLSTIRDVDTIIVLKNGQVVESGNHAELMCKKGEYASMDVKSITTRKQDPNDQKLSQPNFSPSQSIWEVVKLNAPEWPYAILDSVGAALEGTEAPFFALAITHILSTFYSPTGSEIKHEVDKVTLTFVALAGVTVPVYPLQHYFYTLMGERLTSHVRLLMFSGSFQ
ncbi:putative xenobiotic-transporting ATPase [Rosa chinensis]|uniref:Putative xenobiotic-transporting ATPase n=1 Tax=Rosa chinensis TaxID=74649 RepID=A0A2P6PZ71_ROSCH|nr:putative xenobiotic-transporting ATPase [Rosa chinensis]